MLFKCSGPTCCIVTAGLIAVLGALVAQYPLHSAGILFRAHLAGHRTFTSNDALELRQSYARLLPFSQHTTLMEGIRASRAIRLGMDGALNQSADSYDMIPSELQGVVSVRVLSILPSQQDVLSRGGLGSDGLDADGAPADANEVVAADAQLDKNEADLSVLLPEKDDLALTPFQAPLPHVRWVDPRASSTVEQRSKQLLGEKARSAAPSSCSGRSVIYHIHGGGHHIGGSGTEDGRLAHLANSTGLPIAAVSYRLSPEVRFPAHFEDVVRGLAWLGRSGRSLGVDERCVVLMGDSAGGQLAASLALYLRHTKGALPQTEQEASHGLPPLRARAIAQVLVYPLVDTAVHILGPQGPTPSAASSSASSSSSTRDYPSIDHPWADWRPVLPASLMRSFGLGSLPRGALPGNRRGRVGYGVAGREGGTGEEPGLLERIQRVLTRVWTGAAGPLDRIEALGHQHGYYGSSSGVQRIAAQELPLEAQEALNDWRLCPMAARSLANLPPALVVTAGWDPLCDEGKAYCSELKKAEGGEGAPGVSTRCIHFDDAFHGYYGFRSPAMPASFRAATESTDASILELFRDVGAVGSG